MLARTTRLLIMASGSFLVSGCAICCGPYDHDYLASSHLIQRADPSHGRVGSVFSDPYVGAGTVSELPVESLPTPLESPNRLPRQLEISAPQVAPTRSTGAPTAAPTNASSPRKISANQARPLQAPNHRLQRDPIRQVSRTTQR